MSPRQEKSSIQPLFTLIFPLGLLIIAALGLPGLTSNANYRVYFNPDNSLLASFQVFEQEFERRDSLLLIVESDFGAITDQLDISQYQRLESALLTLQQVVEVRGFYDFFSTQNSSLTINPGGIFYLSRDGKAGLIEIDIALHNPKSAQELQALSSSIDIIVKRELDDIRDVQYGGPLALNLAYADVIKHDLRVFIPGLLLLTGLVLFLFLRHWILSVTLLLTGLLAVVIAYGAAGWLEFELAAINAFGPVVIIGLSVATQMHLVLGYVRHLGKGLVASDAITKTLAEYQRPFMLSCMTTAAGFMCLISSPSPPVQRLGITVAIGVSACLILGLTVLPQILIRVNMFSTLINYSHWQQALTKLTLACSRHRIAIIATGMTMGLLGAMALQQLKVDDVVYRYFPEDHAFSSSITVLDQRFYGAVQLQVVLDSERAGGIFSKEFSQFREQFKLWLKQHEQVQAVIDPVQSMADTGVNLSSLKMLAESNMEALSARSDARVLRFINADFSSALITVFLPASSATELMDFSASVERKLEQLNEAAENGASAQFRPPMGQDLIFAHLGQRNATSMFTALAAALLLITMLLGIIFKSVKLGLVGLLCNTLPLLIIYGLWALGGGFISLGSAVVMGMIIGIIVDDTLHLLYRRSRHPEQAVAELTGDIGPALLISSISLVAGLAVGLLSDFRPIWELSLLSIAIILTAMVIDLLVLPALLDNKSASKTR